MKRLFPVFSLSVILLLCSCDGLNLNSVVLDNQSDSNVSVELYLGQNNDDGSMLFESRSVNAQSKTSIPSETDRVYVDGYSPSDIVSMDINKNKITFTNK